MTIEAITADSLAPIPHGFFTRAGGASSGIFSGLNCGKGSSDQSEIVQINRSRVAARMGVAKENLITLNQVHSSDVVVVVEPEKEAAVHGDGMVTATPGIALGILTADCQPVLFADDEAKVVGAAHAGWKGALGGVLEATVDAMETLGAARDRIVAVIGPAISQRNYEVGPEFFETFVAEDTSYARFFVDGSRDRMQFDLPGFGLFRLRQAGIGKAEWTGHCTYEGTEKFYSFRRSRHRREADYGRLISVIRL